MTAPRRQSDDDQTNEDSEQVVDAESADTPEENLVNQGLSDIEAGKQEEDISANLRTAGHILDSLGKRTSAKTMYADAKKYGDAAASDIQRGVKELHQADDLHHQRVVQQLAVQVVDAPDTLVAWRDAVTSITHIVRRQVTREEFVAAAGGDPAQAIRLQNEILTKGDTISRSLGHAVQTAKQAAGIVVQIFEFVSAVLDIYDHVPEPVKQLLWQGLRILAPFLPA